jgi:lipopolysaccharide/colanic/teichoic acid biosynthesis glycosyltransferase
MYPVIKRLIDFFVSFIVLLILSPFLIIIIILLKFTGEGEVFYFQKRIGQNNKYFDIWKFATMLKNSPNIGTGVITLRNDPRVTWMGRFLRKSKLNELPQLINVLIGNMSLVGPRPLVQRTFDAYNDEVKAKIYLSKPGITGIGSIIFRDEEKLVSETDLDPHIYYNTVIAPYKGALELWYLKRKSLWVDMVIIFLTVWVILFPASKLAYKIFKDLPARTF